MNAPHCFIHFTLALLTGATLNAQQVNTGSTGTDGAFNPTQSVTIDMADHSDGIYQYTSVNIPSGVTVTFKPNAKNTPVVWLVSGSCIINGVVDVSGQSAGSGGPGGYHGGAGGLNPTPGEGPGGGLPGMNNGINCYGGQASFGTVGAQSSPDTFGQCQAAPGPKYGNNYLLPFFGGSGGGGGYNRGGGCGGGGAILIAANGTITVGNTINANGGSAPVYWDVSAGSGGSIRLVAPTILGAGALQAQGGSGASGWGYGSFSLDNAGLGRIRIDTYQYYFSGATYGVLTQGFQPIIIPAVGEGVQLSITSVGGVAAPVIPGGVLVNPDVIIPAQQTNPVPIVVNCINLPLNTQITVVVHPANGSDVQAVGLNNVGNLVSSTAIVSVTMPRGGGIIYAKCVAGVAGLSANASTKDLRTKSIAETGWTASGERFAKMEIMAKLGGKQEIAYITESGQRFSMPLN